MRPIVVIIIVIVIADDPVNLTSVKIVQKSKRKLRENLYIISLTGSC